MLHVFRSRRHVVRRCDEIREAGFSLVEILLAMGLAVLIMTAASQLIVSMKRSSDRMRLSAESKLRAQRAIDYLALNIRGATDMNPKGNNPAALLVWYRKGGTTAVQASWNNVTNAGLADVGTDILTIAKPTSSVVARGVSFSSTNNSTPSVFEFSAACPDSAANLALFKNLTGNGQPALLVEEGTGNWGFYQITDYQDAANANCCTAYSPSPPRIQVVANPGSGNLIEPITGTPSFGTPPNLVLGVQFITFRVRNGWLEQKVGLFDPSTDNPGTAFSPIIPDIEDFQVAWAFQDGTIWNTTTQALASGTYTNSVPAQGTSQPYDAINCNALRISVVARSAEELGWDSSALFTRPRIEDHAGATAKDRFFHQRATTLVMIRNRNMRF